MNTFLVFFILNSNYISTRNLSRFTANIFSILSTLFWRLIYKKSNLFVCMSIVNCQFFEITQVAFACSKSTIETLEKGMK